MNLSVEKGGAVQDRPAADFAENPDWDEGDTHFGDFIEDKNALSPASATADQIMQEQLEDVLKTLTPREETVAASSLRHRGRLSPHAGGSGQSFRGDPRARSADRDESLAQTAPPDPQQKVAGFSGLTQRT
jgi:hypothetical protein